ncbi:hypothetical protein [Salinigranum halophilum]|uniref:hypothetical protein n=1 Tax=Salinigranum halophilum TaxID=2565931 RepID=UPI00115F0039|nr:hypothetical protein [Salinigranum halophilum]
MWTRQSPVPTARPFRAPARTGVLDDITGSGDVRARSLVEAGVTDRSQLPAMDSERFAAVADVTVEMPSRGASAPETSTAGGRAAPHAGSRELGSAGGRKPGGPLTRS